MSQYRRVRLSYASKGDPRIRRLMIEAIEYLTGRHRFEKLYADIEKKHLDPAVVWGELLKGLNIRLNYAKDQLKKVPSEGPLIFIANHPFGVVDGLILGHLAGLVRPKFFVLANALLFDEHLLQEYLLPIDFRPTKSAMRTNILTKQTTLKRLNQGEALVIFPAGGVATAPKILGRAQDLEWKRFVAKVIHKTQAMVIPIFVHGQNSRLFHLASRISMDLRLSLLLNEVRNKMGKTIDIEIGSPITYQEIAKLKDRQALVTFLRRRTLNLPFNNEF